MKAFIRSHKHNVIHGVCLTAIVILTLVLNLFTNKNQDLVNMIISEKEKVNELAAQNADLQEINDKLTTDYNVAITQQETLKGEMEPFLKLSEAERTLIKEKIIELEEKRVKR